MIDTVPVATQHSKLLRLVIFAACIPQAGSLLLKVYGLCSLQAAFLALAVPGILIITAVYLWAKKQPDQFLRNTIELGFLGGLAGTIAYDLARIPFLLMGLRIFAPISAYGVWLLDSNFSNRFSDLAGWGYHFLNGISFGVMYSLFMRSRPAFWAIIWGCGLETIAFLSPFGRIFGFNTNANALAIAYFGHIVYGIPLGLLLMKDQSALRWLKSVPTGLYYFAVVLVGAYAVGQTTLPEKVAADKSVEQGKFYIKDNKLYPDWIRITHQQIPSIVNKTGQQKTIVVKQLNSEILIPSETQQNLDIKATGIYQVFVKTPERTQSSFLMIEPVEK